ncbi:hypothetical protein C8J56DRAFT_920646, partial [Mycena floridula]
MSTTFLFVTAVLSQQAAFHGRLSRTTSLFHISETSFILHSESFPSLEFDSLFLLSQTLITISVLTETSTFGIAPVIGTRFLFTQSDIDFSICL